MHAVKQANTPSSFGTWWRLVLLLFIVFGSLALTFMLSEGPIRQSLKYHCFADQRTILGISNFLDVTSNILFLLVGVAGIIFCPADRKPSVRIAWLTFFLGVAMVSVGSAYYHLNPDNERLFWDRLPMTIGFMGLFAALLGEYVSVRFNKTLLTLALLLGFFSVLYWKWVDDLRLYSWVQVLPLLTIPFVMILFRSRYSHQWMLLVALALYVLAKISECYDGKVFEISHNLFSGHTLKHLLAASSCFAVLVMLWLRKTTDNGAGFSQVAAPDAWPSRRERVGIER